MTDIQIFNNPQFGEIRTAGTPDNPMFCATDVCRALGYTNGRKAEPGTIRGDFSMSNQQNIVHASDSVENAQIELCRFFRPEEIFDYQSGAFGYVYGDGECK